MTESATTDVKGTAVEVEITLRVDAVKVPLAHNVIARTLLELAEEER